MRENQQEKNLIKKNFFTILFSILIVISKMNLDIEEFSCISP